ncbi:hypothetical protein OROHE_025512 [Orobanche hederae]
MAAWSSRRRAFEYSCNFSIDEAMMAAYGQPAPPPHPEVVRTADLPPVANLVAEVRTNFYIKGKGEEGEKRWLGSERFGAVSSRVYRLREQLAPRLRDYCLSTRQIESLLDAARLPKAPTVLDLEICSRSLVEEEAMRPETLRPLDITPPLVMRMPRLRERNCWIPYCQPSVINEELMTIMSGKWEDMKFILTLIRMYEEEGVRVYHEEKGVAMMLECGMCRGRPFVGSVIIKLGCGHLFHYHCVVPSSYHSPRFSSLPSLA